MESDEWPLCGVVMEGIGRKDSLNDQYLDEPLHREIQIQTHLIIPNTNITHRRYEITVTKDCRNKFEKNYELKAIVDGGEPICLEGLLLGDKWSPHCRIPYGWTVTIGVNHWWKLNLRRKNK